MPRGWIPRGITQYNMDMGKFLMLTLSVAGDNPGGSIKTPPTVQEMLYMSYMPVGE